MIELQNLTKTYDKTKVIENTNYTFPNTGMICLLGESGCGKTTLLNLIAGLDTEYSGKIIVDNIALSTLSESDLCNYRKDYIGFVFQDYHLLHGYRVIDNIVYPCVLNSECYQRDIQRAQEILKEIGLLDKAYEKVQNLSGGQKQRVAIARAIIKYPKMILADEPTGALDRKTATEIMEILKEISKTKLVILITHDHHICDYADEIITIEDKKICIQSNNIIMDRIPTQEMKLCPPKKINQVKLSCKNFKNSFAKYLLVATIFSIGVICMMFSLSTRNIVDNTIKDFKEDNIVFNNGYIKNEGNQDVYKKLKKDKRMDHIYKQYVLKNVTISMKNHAETMNEKYPMPKTSESMSYGSMPRNNKNEIALSPSLAKKFNPRINCLIGKQLVMEYNSRKYSLTISGIYNAEYDDFFISSDVEQSIYQGLEKQPYFSISYDVKKFEDIVEVSESLSKEDIQSENASEQVKTMQTTFSKIQTLFLVISGMILFVSVFIVMIILIKMQSARYKMVGLQYSFGFQKNTINKMIIIENVLLTILVSLITSILFIISQCIVSAYGINMSLGINEFLITIGTSSCIILVLNAVINRKLINTRPVNAFKH